MKAFTIRTIAFLFTFGLFVGAANAEGAKDIIEDAEEFYKGSCGKALKLSFKAGMKEAKAAKSSCKDFRNCKKKCRKAKKSAKAECKGLKGKEKRACKKGARKEKRDCVKSCRKVAKTPACKKARMGLVKTLMKSAKELAKNQKCKEYAKKAASAIEAAGK